MAAKLKKTVKFPQPGRVRITNIGFQGIEVFVTNGLDYDSYWLAPKSSVEIKKKQVTDIIRNLVKRQILTISDV